MSEDPNVTVLAAAAWLEERAAEEGAQYGPLLLLKPPSAWRRLMRSDERYRGYGTLKFLLEKAREKFDSEPTVAHQITAAVLHFVADARGPSRVHETGLRGLAWKEHATTCEKVGDLRAALRAAERAIDIYGTLPALLFDQTRARLVACKIHREMGNTDRALQLARECAVVFREHGSLTFTNMARLFEGGVLCTLKRYREALDIFTGVMEHAERERDTLTVARCLQNAAECARELGDLKGARDLYPRALDRFESLQMPTETTRVRWGYALTLAAEGKIASAVSELFIVRAMYLHLGMNSHAASAALDIVRIRFDVDQDIRELCTELVRVFTEAGLTQNAIEALAYLRETAREGRLTATTINRVRTYFSELSAKPMLQFVPARGSEDG